MAETTFIYALCEPGTRTVRYIGKANNPETRLKYGHLLDSIKLTTHLGRWLQKIVAEGKEPFLIVLSKVSELSWKEEEMRYISAARMLGMDLVNATDGGEGVTQTPEIRKKIGDGNRGKPRSTELRDRLRKASIGQVHTAEHNAKIGAGVRGKKKTLEQKKRYSLSKLGDKNPMFGKTGALHHSFGKKFPSKTLGVTSNQIESKQANE